MEENIRENKMGTMPIGKLLANMAGPVMISMLFQALYNIVDSVFVAKLSQDAMNAVSLAFPLQMLCIAFSVGTGVGINALLARSLGEKNQVAVNRAAGHRPFSGPLHRRCLHAARLHARRAVLPPADGQ